MKNILIISLLTISFACMTSSCKKTLDYQPKGVVAGDQLNTPENVEKLVIAAYAALGNDHWLMPYTNAWPYGSIRSGDSYKGGLGNADLGIYHELEIFSTLRVDNELSNALWQRLYIGVQRANLALQRINNLDESQLPDKSRLTAEMRFVRAHFNFLLKVQYKRIPYLDETITDDSISLVSNVQYTNDELWEKIADDFQSAIDNLPETQDQIGRPNKIAAAAYLAKVRLYQAYEQDDQNNVTSINPTHLNEVLTLTDEVINSGKYQLSEDYAENFLWQYENGLESVFAVQRSINDGTTSGRIDMSSALNFPMYPGYGCCSFHRPSQNLINAFQTDAAGLPKFDTYNNVEMKDPEDFQDNTFDPRLDHTAGIPGHPYKYQNNIIYTVDGFTRQPEVYGPFSSMKEVTQVDCSCLTQVKGYPYPASSTNNDVIRFDDVLLWKAEALIELDRQDEALSIINEIRQRAKNSTGRLKDEDGNFYSNYKIELYQPGTNITWTKEEARKVLRWERRLEFGMEANRFFDLVRWGIAAEYINDYFEVEKTRRTYLGIAHFTKNKDEYLPIPQQQIELSSRLYQQNTGW